jgi:RES domain-containing protein
LRFVGRCYRAHDPAWSFSPLSGGGAALIGGRFNRKGEPTLYLSRDVMTSFGECTQGFTSRLQPLTMCEYEVDCDDVVDLSSEAARRARRVDRNDLACAWLSFQLTKKQAPSWLIVDRLKAEGCSGMLVPSFVPGATEVNINLVLWRWGADLPHKIEVYDPSGRLPQNQLSWPEHGKPAR